MLRLFYVGALFLVITVWRSVDSCSCTISHPQTQYCKSDFVVLATAKRMGQDPNGLDAFYSLQLDAIVKGDTAAKEALKHGRVYTGLQSATCGVYLKIDEQYLLSGSIYGGRARIDLCGLHAIWRDVPLAQRISFQNLFKKSCTCTVCPTQRVGGCTPSATQCSYDYQSDSGNCHSNYGVCLPQRGVCTWNRYDGLDKCLAG